MFFTMEGTCRLSNYLEDVSPPSCFTRLFARLQMLRSWSFLLWWHVLSLCCPPLCYFAASSPLCSQSYSYMNTFSSLNAVKGHILALKSNLFTSLNAVLFSTSSACQHLVPVIKPAHDLSVWHMVSSLNNPAMLHLAACQYCMYSLQIIMKNIHFILFIHFISFILF